MLKKTCLILCFIVWMVLPTFAQEGTNIEEEETYHCPAFTSASSAERTSYYMGEGAAYMQRGDYSSALNSYGCIISEINPSYRDAYLNRAAAYAARRIYEEAFEDYDSAIAIDDDFAPAYNNRAILFMAIAEYDDALNDFNRAISLDADYAEAYINRGVLSAIRESYSSAENDFRQAIRLANLDRAVADLRNPNRAEDAPFPVFDMDIARAYALIGTLESIRALDNYDNYLLLTQGRADGRVQSAAGALRSRFNFELRFDDGSWLLVADFIED